MKRAMDFSPLHLMFSIPLLIGMCIMAVAGIVGLEQIQGDLEPWVFWFANIFGIMIIPFTLFFVFFTKFNNPFRKIPEKDGSPLTLQEKGND